MYMKRKAIFPGSFDPFTIGHESIVKRGLELFDELIIGVGYNANKNTLFSQDAREEMIRDVFKDEPRIVVKGYKGLTVDFALENNAQFILRGIRTSADFEYERAIAQVNRKMSGIESVFLLTTPEHTPVNSGIVRDVLRHGGNVSMFIPEKIDLKKYLND